MPTRILPPRPNLAQLKLQAKELLREYRDGKASAAARIAAHDPKHKGRLILADAQRVLAREYGFENWAQLKERIERGRKIATIKPHRHFNEALTALRSGDTNRLREVLVKHPALVFARTNLDAPYGYFSGATLLHHVTANPGWNQPLPQNIVQVARLLLESGAEVDAVTLGPNRSTTMGLVLTSKQASDANVSGPLIDLLLEFGDKLDLKRSSKLIPDWGERNILDLSLANHAPRAAEKLIELGAKVDVCAAAALGRMDLLRDCFDPSGKLKSNRTRKPMSDRDAIGLALLFAYVRQQRRAIDFLLEKDGNWNMTGVNNGAVLHRAAWKGDLPMVEKLVARGADMSNRDNPFHSTPLSWAQHNQQQEVFDWMRKNCRIDLHEAVCFDLREHIEARLREDPSSINQRIDHWDIPQCTPLHWAAWTHVEDVDGTHTHDEAKRKELVKLLLDRGADINIVAGNGCTALDIAAASKAPSIVKLLKEHGGKCAAAL
jgi:hypothetical protein